MDMLNSLMKIQADEVIGNIKVLVLMKIVIVVTYMVTFAHMVGKTLGVGFNNIQILYIAYAMFGISSVIIFNSFKENRSIRLYREQIATSVYRIDDITFKVVMAQGVDIWLKSPTSNSYYIFGEKEYLEDKKYKAVISHDDLKRISSLTPDNQGFINIHDIDEKDDALFISYIMWRSSVYISKKLKAAHTKTILCYLVIMLAGLFISKA
jgi:hypothetical protein